MRNMRFLDAGNNQRETEIEEREGGHLEITIELLLHATKLSVGKHENLSQFLKRITHLTLNGNVSTDQKKQKDHSGFLCKIQNLHHCPNLKVLYLYDNQIKTIENLDGIPQLTHLHLQNNRLQRIENLERLTLLEKLYLENNSIVKLEGLSDCLQLQELYLANQKIPINLHFSFDEDTLRTLACSLRVLDLSNCRVVSSKPLGGLLCLEQLDLSKNLICDLEDIFALVGSVPSLVELDLRGNEVTLEAKYREKTIIFSSQRLALLDKKEINANQRRMMQSHLAHKYRKRTEPSSRVQGPSSSKERQVKFSNAEPRKRSLAEHQLHSSSISLKSHSEKNGLEITGASCNPNSSALLVKALNNNSKFD